MQHKQQSFFHLSKTPVNKKVMYLLRFGATLGFVVFLPPGSLIFRKLKTLSPPRLGTTCQIARAGVCGLMLRTWCQANLYAGG